MRRLLDLIASVLVLIAAAPLMLLLAMAVKVQDDGPIFFRQQRVGRNGCLFTLWKFRSMRIRNQGAPITSSGDRRITPLGRFLRRYKLDELPQLWNVLRGDMSLIGPRPEVPHFVVAGDPVWQAVHRVRPGITDVATLVYRDEERILAGYDDPERAYRDAVLPAKLALNLEYLRQRSLGRDLKLLALTIRYSFVRDGFDPDRIRHALLSRNS
jgi:lipopolysaccharide/colanic/teichoic acid biosynthesis glycosyltransferase